MGISGFRGEGTSSQWYSLRTRFIWMFCNKSFFLDTTPLVLIGLFIYICVYVCMYVCIFFYSYNVINFKHNHEGDTIESIGKLFFIHINYSIVRTNNHFFSYV